MTREIFPETFCKQINLLQDPLRAEDRFTAASNCFFEARGCTTTAEDALGESVERSPKIVNCNSPRCLTRLLPGLVHHTTVRRKPEKIMAV